jgi:serine/threonine-protein kinase
MLLAPGTRLGPYEIETLIGTGGMGEVYRARDTRLERAVALKILPVSASENPDRARRFLLEARAASALSHPNVAHIYEVGDFQGAHFIAMEYVEGQTLARKIGGKPVASAELVDIAAQAADALDEAHAKGVVHRDIKPGNIMLTPRGQVKVLDFGLAKLAPAATPSEAGETLTAAITKEGSVMGTVQYMSPEQVLGRPVDARSDIFSLGVVLYEMATGRLPFAGPTETETMHRIVQAQPDAVARFNYEISPEVERIIRKCLEKERERRYQSARDLVVDLRNWKRDAETVSHAVAAPVMPRRKWLAVAAVVLLAGAAATWYALTHGHEKQIDSIAVLPFTNTGNDPNLEYLSDGLTEQIINNLAQVPNLKVIARATVFTYKGKQPDVTKVASDLRVRAVLLGRVTLRGDEAVIQADLVDGSEGSQLWGQRFQRSAKDIQGIQGEITGQVLNRLGMKAKAAGAHRVADPEAYKLYLQGRYLLSFRTAERVRTSLERFRQAVALDPGFALAHAGVADALIYVATMELELPHEKMAQARAAAQEALKIDSGLGEAHTSLGTIKLLYDWDVEGAQVELRRGLELAPGNAYCRHWYAHYMDAVGRLDDAINELEKALEVEPLTPMFWLDLSEDLRFAGRYEKSATHARKALELDPANPEAHMILGRALEFLGRRQESMAELDKAVAETGENWFVMGFASSSYARQGNLGSARKLLAKMEESSRKGYVPAFELAVAWLGVGEAARALEFLEKACQERTGQFFYFLRDAIFDGVRTDPRFLAIMKKYNPPGQPRVTAGTSARPGTAAP